MKKTPITNAFAGLRFENFNFETELAVILNYNHLFLFAEDKNEEVAMGAKKFFNEGLISCNFTFSKTDDTDKRPVAGFQKLVPVLYGRHMYFFQKEDKPASNYQLVGRVTSNMFLGGKKMEVVDRKPQKLMTAINRFWCSPPKDFLKKKK